MSKDFSYKLRNLVVGVDVKVPTINGEKVTYINFDNAATTPPFKKVLNDIISFCPLYSSIHRGSGYKSLYSSKLYDESRKIVKSFVNAKKDDTVIYVNNTTEAINRLSYIICKEEDVILSTLMEHHSNDLPWRSKCRVDYIELDENGRLSLDSLKEKINIYKDKIKLVCVTGASNVTGYINPIYEIAEIVHKNNSMLLVDGAQLVPHHPINMNPKKKEKSIDFLVFSSHKMYSPFGIGVLIGPKKVFQNGKLDYTGGGTVKFVTLNRVIYEDTPYKNEPGSPNIIGVVGLISSIKLLSYIGMNRIKKYENYLTKYAYENLIRIKDIIVYVDSSENRISTIPFNIKGIHHEIVAKALSFESGIAVRSGCFCAQPYVAKLLRISDEEISYYIKNPNIPRPGMVRISFGLYNNTYEIDKLISKLKNISKNKIKYIKKYGTVNN